MGMVMSARHMSRYMEISAMVRPRGGDFLYTEDELILMKKDIDLFRQVGTNCVVLGLLHSDGSVDVKGTRELVEVAGDMEVTFHRAFDMVKDWRQALEDVISTGCKRILTSGCAQTAEEGIDVIREMVYLADGRIEIMAGSGVNPSNAAKIAATGVDAIHFSAGKFVESQMIYRHPKVALSYMPERDYLLQRSDYDAMKAIIETVGNMQRTVLE